MAVPNQHVTPELAPRQKAPRGGAARRARAMASVVASEMQPGETIELATVAEVGSLAPVAAATAVRVARGAAAGAGVVPMVRRRRYGVMLTNRRLLFIEANQRTGRFVQVARSLPREKLVRSAVVKRVYVSYSVLEAGTGRKLCKLSFPVPARRDGLQIAAAFAEVAS